MKKLLKKIIPQWVFGIYHWKWAFFSALVYGFPSRRLKVIGITGTKGKSTVVVLAGAILRQGFGMVKVGWISSLTINNGEKEVMNPYHMTMPGRFFIQKTLRQMVKNGCEYALVEVTSEGIKQHRHRFIKWAGAVFTNLAPEHLEAHGGFENYRKAKEKLFEAAAKNKESFGVYNLDDKNAQHFFEFPIKNKYGITQKNNFQFSPALPRLGRGRAIFNFQSILKFSNVKLTANGSEFEINGVKFKTNLLGEFNVYNCGAAIGVGAACGVDLEIAARALEKIKSIPGRLEMIDEGQDFTVVVDLAHTPDSFSQIFNLFKNLAAHRILPDHRNFSEGGGEGGSRARIISVFGSAGGGRDKWKRPELGKIASKYADIIILTNEDPYDEDPSQILSEIKSGISNFPASSRLQRGEQFPISNLYEIQDRKEAIAKALGLARTGDIVLVLGKGTEQTLVIGGKKQKWDDREVVREELRKINFRSS